MKLTERQIGGIKFIIVEVGQSETFFDQTTIHGKTKQHYYSTKEHHQGLTKYTVFGKKK